LSITSVDTDYDRLTVSIIADFDASLEQVWELWSNPRKLERWWGPPDYPATFQRHDLRPGGEATYFMTGPDADDGPAGQQGQRPAPSATAARGWSCARRSNPARTWRGG
jgi:hypothetical protein